MRTVKDFLVVFFSVVLISGNSINANTDVYGTTPGDCSDLLSTKEMYTTYEKEIAHTVAALTQRVINEGLLSLEDLAMALAQENYDISKVAAKGYDQELPLFKISDQISTDAKPADVLGYVEKVFAITNLPDTSRRHIGKLVLLKLMDIQTQTNRPEVDRLWTQLSAARVLNALIRDRVILSGEFTDLVLQETARELNVGEVYPGGGHLHLNKKIAGWIRERNWDMKTDELKRIAYFVTLSLQQKTQNFSNYFYLINIDKEDKSVFDSFVRELVQSMVIDTLELSLIVRQDRPFSARDSMRVAGTNAAATGLMVASTQVIFMGDVPSLTAMAAGGAICGAYLMWSDVYAHFKGWLAHRRLALRWKESTQQQCQVYDAAIIKSTHKLMSAISHKLSV